MEKMLWLYINKEWYLCLQYNTTNTDWEMTLSIIKFKVNKDWLFERVI